MAAPGDPGVVRHVIFTTQPGRGDELSRRLLSAAEGLRTLDACRLYVVSRVPGDRDVVHVTERWTSRAAVAEALDLPGVREEVAEVMALLAGAPEVTETVPAGGVGLDEGGGARPPGG